MCVYVCWRYQQFAYLTRLALTRFQDDSANSLNSWEIRIRKLQNVFTLCSWLNFYFSRKSLPFVSRSVVHMSVVMLLLLSLSNGLRWSYLKHFRIYSNNRASCRPANITIATSIATTAAMVIMRMQLIWIMTKPRCKYDKMWVLFKVCFD